MPLAEQNQRNEEPVTFVRPAPRVESRRWLKVMRDVLFVWVFAAFVCVFGGSWVRQQFGEQVWDNLRFLFGFSLIPILLVAEGTLLVFTRDVWHMPGYFGWGLRLLVGGQCASALLFLRIGVNSSLPFVLPTPLEVVLTVLGIAGLITAFLGLGVLSVGAVIESIGRRRMRA